MFIKFIKESDLISKQMTQQTYELMFTHEKGHETHLHYPQFIKALRSIASSVYPKTYVHGKFKGNNAQLMKVSFKTTPRHGHFILIHRFYPRARSS